MHGNRRIKLCALCLRCFASCLISYSVSSLEVELLAVAVSGCSAMQCSAEGHTSWSFLPPSRPPIQAIPPASFPVTVHSCDHRRRDLTSTTVQWRHFHCIRLPRSHQVRRLVTPRLCAQRGSEKKTTTPLQPPGPVSQSAQSAVYLDLLDVRSRYVAGFARRAARAQPPVFVAPLQD